MRKIINPYDPEKNMCFGCGVANNIGLKLRFTDHGDFIQAEWQPLAHYQGYPNILHGGIIAALLDETGGWYVSAKIGTAGVTSEMTTRYLAPVSLDKGPVTVRASLESSNGKNAVVNCQLFDGQEKLCAEARAQFFLYPVEVAIRKFRYPGQQAFYGED